MVAYKLLQKNITNLTVIYIPTLYRVKKWFLKSLCILRAVQYPPNPLLHVYVSTSNITPIQNGPSWNIFTFQEIPQ